jgi:hypothetical protein
MHACFETSMMHACFETSYLLPLMHACFATSKYTLPFPRVYFVCNRKRSRNMCALYPSLGYTWFAIAKRSRNMRASSAGDYHLHSMQARNMFRHLLRLQPSANCPAIVLPSP